VGIRQSDFWAKYLQELGWQAKRLDSNLFAYVKKIPFLGSLIKIPRAPLPLPFKKIDELASSENAIFVKLEPAIETKNITAASTLNLLKGYGFAQDRWSLNPTKTIVVDLTKSEEELLKGMEKDTRYNVHLAIRKGVVVKETNNFEEFKNLYFQTAARKRFWPAKKELEALWKVFSKEKAASILTAFYQNEPLASTLLLYINKAHLGAKATQDAREPKSSPCNGRRTRSVLLSVAKSFSYVASYYHAASAVENRKVMAPYLLLWEAIRFLKKKGCTSFDLEGIYDSRIPSTKGWKGFTLFKKGFGGREVEYLGSFTKYYKLWSKVLFFPSRFF
jgi:lipid II:glycine glycyltransferase (peptidoglycan interpeptide bridge formation enzyme)